MKNLIFALSLILIVSAVGFGQKQKVNPEPADQLEPRETNKVSSKNKRTKNDPVLRSGTSLEAQLEQTLDVKRAEVGDEVVLKVTKSIKQEGQVIVPKGARLVGRVTEVQEKTKQNAMSKLGVVFDRIEGKNLNAPISATITSITGATSRAAVGDVFATETSGSSSSSGTVSRENSGGGLLGGVTNTAGVVLNTATNTVGGITDTTGQTVGGATRTLGNTVNGIRISQSGGASADGSTLLSAQGGNLKLEKGATLRLRVSESFEK